MSRIDMRWKLHLPNLLKEISKGSGQSIYRIPVSMLRALLWEVAQRASELNDAQLNDLMCRLALYELSDPESKDYDPKAVRSIQRIAALARRKKK